MNVHWRTEYTLAGVEKCSHPLKSQRSSALCGKRTETGVEIFKTFS